MFNIQEELKKYENMKPPNKKTKHAENTWYVTMLAIQNIAEILEIIANRIPDVQDWAMIGSKASSVIKKHKK